METIYYNAKELGKEVGTYSVKIFVALYKGLPVELSDNVYFPQPAEDVLIALGNMKYEQKIFLSSHLTLVENVSENSIILTEDNSDSFIKGKTTFDEIIALGIKKEDIESALKTNISDTSLIIKDFCTENGLEFSIVKTEIQKMIDEK